MPAAIHLFPPVFDIGRMRMVVIAIDHVRRNDLMEKSGDQLNSNDAGQEEADEEKGCSSWGVAVLHEVFLGGGEHAVEGGEELYAS